MEATRPPIIAVRLTFSGVEVVLGLGESVIGRGEDCALRLEDPLMSRKHALLTVSADAVTIRDLGSRNGVLVNGDAASDDQVLVESDLVTVGSHALLVREIRRAPLSSPPAQAAVEGASAPRPRGIVLSRRPSIATPSIAFSGPTMTTMGNGSRPVIKPIGAYRLIGEAAQRAFAAGKVQQGVAILDTPLRELLAALRAGSQADGETLELVVELGVSTFAATHDERWASFVRDVYTARRMSLPASIIACLALARES